MRRLSRRTLLKLAAASGIAGIGGLAATLFSKRANAYYSGAVSDHFDGVEFYNAGARTPAGFDRFLRLFITETWEPWPSQVQRVGFDTPPRAVGSEQARISFIGHASWLIQADGLNVLIDPVWAARVSPFSFVGPRRVTEPGVAFDALPPIDVVLITHNHYDHLDLETLERLWSRDRPRILTPLGNDTIIRARLSHAMIAALDWHQSLDLSNSIRVHAVPSLHWSARGLRDRRHALWASFVVETSAGSIYAVGDTGFGDGATFRDIGHRHPGLALALLPIGAYEPRWFMRDQHMNPDEAVQAFELCAARRALGHHWGTFPLTTEGPERPRKDLTAALTARSVAADRFKAARPGDVLTLQRGQG